MSQTYKPVEAKDRETTHRAKEEVSTKGPSSILESSQSNDSAESISFFGVLPRELRDAVYDYTFEHVVERECGTDDGVTFHFHVPVSNLRLVSRQFTAEYDERYKTLSSKKSILSIVINSRDNCRIWYSRCPQPAFRCRELSTTLSLFDGSDEYTETALRDVLKTSISHFHNTTILAKCKHPYYRVRMRHDIEYLHHSG